MDGMNLDCILKLVCKFRVVSNLQFLLVIDYNSPQMCLICGNIYFLSIDAQVEDFSFFPGI